MENNIIIYAGGFILPDRNAAAHRVISNAKIFRELGYKVILIGVSKELNIDESEVKYFQGFSYYEKKYPTKYSEWIKYLTSIEDIIRVTSIVGKNKINSLILYNYPSIALYRILNVFKKNGVKVISDCTEWYGAVKGSLYHRVLKKLDNKIRIKYLNKKTDGIICISKYLFNYYKDISNKTIIPPLVDLNENKWPRNLNNLPQKKAFTYIGSPGSTNEKESFFELLTIFNELSSKYEFTFNIVGISKEEIYRNIPKSSLTKENYEYINFWGIQDNKKCIELISESHFFIFLRYNSIVTSAGFPTKFVESISAGTPVLTNNSSNLSDFIIESKNGFMLNTNSMDSILNTVEKCLNLSTDKIIEMKNFCKNSETFHYTNYISSMQKILSYNND